MVGLLGYDERVDSICKDVVNSRQSSINAAIIAGPRKRPRSWKLSTPPKMPSKTVEQGQAYWTEDAVQIEMTATLAEGPVMVFRPGFFQLDLAWRSR